ncbi:PREDICTED: MATH domain and coiled-coil domain-containing protein At3g29580-like [Camelina sativa]|uniref:MATH domain and coiled-coil domain-containing protein At3g29580-like n=1 Tax=Camelina sativa TaxID=90675 RepID=A0ABM0SKH8_CAMSA|nr:PREDICTED: MATH domain and coiled-coil domain-containing protein At3g29580-like [Camelina sativa]
MVVMKCLKDLIRETTPLMGSIDVNGFQVVPSQVKFVKHIFDKHPDFALEFRPKNSILKTVYTNVLPGLTETLRRLPREISKDDLSGAYDSLRSMKDAGFRLDWLEKRLIEVITLQENSLQLTSTTVSKPSEKPIPSVLDCRTNKSVRNSSVITDGFPTSNY